MSFNSIDYFIFLPIVFALYWSTPHKSRWIVILISSYFFYMSWNAQYALLIFLTTFTSYVAAQQISISTNFTRKKIYLLFTIIFNIGILIYFKYFNFLLDVFRNIFANTGTWLIDVILPVGISFYTFQTISYVIDVYRNQVPAEKHFGYYAAFVIFFPQLVAGPIERSGNLLPQLKQDRCFSYDQATYGIKKIAWGLYKKIAIADMIAVYVNRVYNDVFAYKGFALVFATFLFGIQIYCDFSGYSDIAIGSAKLFGIDLMENFHSPYFSKNIREFWSRWHISLGKWFKDYVYIPLGGNRKGIIRYIFNILVVFALSGLWHGPALHFVLWGLYFGIISICERLLLSSKKMDRFSAKPLGLIIRVFITYLVVNLGWCIFRSNSMSELAYIIQNAFIGLTSVSVYIRSGVASMGITIWTIFRIVLQICILGIFDVYNLRNDIFITSRKWKKPLKWMAYFTLFIMIVIFSQKGDSAQFVYFQF